MNLLEIALLSQFSSSLAIITYKGYALPRGWVIGQLYYEDASILKIVAVASMVGSAIAAFFFVEWYYVIAGIVIGKITGSILTAIFHYATQYVLIIILVASYILCVIHIYLSMV